MIREAQWCSIVVNLPQVAAFPQDAIGPRRNSELLASVVVVRANIVLVSGHECDPSFRVVREDQSSNHLQIQLIVLVHCAKVSFFAESANFFVTEADSVVEVSKPNYCIIIVDESVSLKVEALADGSIISVSLFVVCKASC